MERRADCLSREGAAVGVKHRACRRRRSAAPSPS